MPISTRCSPRSPGSPATPARISSSTPGTCSTPAARHARPCPVPACAQRPVRGGAGRGGSGQPRLARAAGGPGIRRDGVRGPGRTGVPRVKFVARAGIPATAGSSTTRHGTASSGSGWRRCRSSTRTGSWTTSPARPAAPATTPGVCAISRPSCQRGLLDGYQPDRDVLVFAAHLYVEGAVPVLDRAARRDQRHLPDRSRRPADRSATPHSATFTGRRRSPAAAWSPATPAARCSWTSARPVRTRASSWSTPTPAARSESSWCR